MAAFPRVSLRRVWRPAPGWPRPPKGFRPPPGWTPDPSWPSAPPGWTGWRIRRVLLTAAFAVALFGILAIIGVVHQSATTHDERVLHQRGIATAAELLRSEYDPGGGDPNGWTTDTVQFHDSGGHLRQAVVGHHGDDQIERASGTLTIVYDPEHPDVVMSAQQLADSAPGGDLALAFGFTAVVWLAAIALLLPAIQISKTHRRGGTETG
jgi:hypothetical protein